MGLAKKMQVLLFEFARELTNIELRRALFSSSYDWELGHSSKTAFRKQYMQGLWWLRNGINNHYYFCHGLDNHHYGGGSKINPLIYGRENLVWFKAMEVI